MTPTIRPKPQLIQQAMAETSVTVAIAAAGVFGKAAILRMPFLMAGAPAKVAPQTKISDICMEKANSPHTPLPQCSTTSTGVWWHTGMAVSAAMRVSKMARTNGSGRYFCTKLTQKLMIFIRLKG